MLSHLSIPSLHQMVTLSTHISAHNCTPPSLPLVQLSTTDPSSPGINAHDYTPPSLPPFQLPSTADPSSPSADDEEVVFLGAVFVPPAETTSPAVNLAINDSTHAAGKEDTEISDVVAKDRNTLSDEKGIVLFRVGQNLKHLHHARKAIKGKVYGGVNSHWD